MLKIILLAHAISAVRHAIFAGILPTGISGDVFWPYFAGVVVSAFGLPRVLEDVSRAHGFDRIPPFGRLFLAVPMAVFGAQHFTAAIFVARLVPSWIPWHLFWTYFVGVALISAALSIVTGKHARLAAALLAILLCLFVALMHIPALVSAPHDRIRLAVALRDLAFSAGALALAATRPEASRARATNGLVTVARFLLAIPVLVFAVEHLLHPGFAPGVPLSKVTPAWIPVRLFWSYFTAMVFIPAGIALVVKKQSRLAASGVGIVVLLLVLFIYLPILVASPADIANGLNYLVDTLALSGSALAVAAALPKPHPGLADGSEPRVQTAMGGGAASAAYPGRERNPRAWS
jgi:uncharacterized membrane protein